MVRRRRWIFPRKDRERLDALASTGVAYQSATASDWHRFREEQPLNDPDEPCPHCGGDCAPQCGTHPAGCIYGGPAQGYWLVAEECQRQHDTDCDLRVIDPSRDVLPRCEVCGRMHRPLPGGGEDALCDECLVLCGEAAGSWAEYGTEEWNRRFVEAKARAVAGRGIDRLIEEFETLRSALFTNALRMAFRKSALVVKRVDDPPERRHE